MCLPHFRPRRSLTALCLTSKTLGWRENRGRCDSCAGSECRNISLRSKNAFSPRGTKLPVGAVQCVLRPSLVRKGFRLCLPAPVCTWPCPNLVAPGCLPLSLRPRSLGSSHVPLPRMTLRLPAREFRNPAMGIAHFPAAAKFCNVHERHSHFAAPPRPERPSREYQLGRANLLTAPPNPGTGSNGIRGRESVYLIGFAPAEKDSSGYQVPGTVYPKQTT